MLAVGALVWLTYAVAWVVMRGPVLDEAVVAAPIITGALAYPAGHPNAVVYRHAPALSYQLAALQWAIVPNPWLLAATRNVLFLFLSTFVPFAATLACTRRPAWGHVAATLTVSETGCSLIGVYLMWVFPGVYSTGHLGIHLAVLAVVLVVAGLGRTGGFLAGLLPVVHGPMTLVAWPALMGLLAWTRVPRRAVLTGATAGMLVAAVVVATIAWRTAGDASSALYAAGADGPVVLATYTASTDPHRQPFPVWSSLGVVGPTALVVLTGLALAVGESDRLVRAGVVALGGLGVIAWGWVLGTRGWQAFAGGLPAPVLALIPGRYANLAMLLVLPLATTVLAVSSGAAPWIAVALLGLEAGLAIGARRLAFAMLLWVVLGAAVGSAVGGRGLRRSAAVAGALAVSAALAMGGDWRAFAAAALVSAVVATLVRGDAWASPLAHRALAIACVVAALAAMRGPHVPNEWDAGSGRRSADERGLATWLAAHAPADAMLVAPLWPPTWLQPKTGHPVLVDTMTLANLAYFPSTASAAGRLVRDVFGIDYADPAAVDRLRGVDGMLRPTSPVWTAAWAARDCAGWRRLGATYGFRHVWAERAHPVRLPVAWSGTGWALHEVPDVCGTEMP